MRLTLRTLLAYLDDTLEPQDAEILRQKVEQSGFATQLVQRIRSSVADPSLSAPAPDSVHPIEEPNMMSNYLDSTLSPEQIAEIEKACLESLPHLAEAAACHQILTMVLGRPAEVSDQLRGRILAMVDANGKVVEGAISARGGQFGTAASSAIAGEIGPRYSGVDLSGAAGGQPTSDDQPEVADQPIVDPRDEGPHDVRPVGADDSGVFQAATKLREQSHQFAEAGTAMDDVVPFAGDRPLRPIERSDLYEGEVRSSRIAPWLVSLALVATLLFAISQIFAPLLAPKVASTDDGEFGSGPDPEIVISDESDATDDSSTTATPPSESSTSGESVEVRDAKPAVVEPTEPETTVIDAEMLPAPEPEALIPESDSPADLEETLPLGETVDSMIDKLSGADTSTDIPVGPAELPGADQVVMEDSEGPPLPPGLADERIASLPEREDTGVNVPAEKVPAMESATDPVDSDPAAATKGIAKLVSDNALVAGFDGESDWKLLAPESSVLMNQRVVCGPEYRARFLVAGNAALVGTLVGATEVRWFGGDETINLQIRFGKGIIQLSDPGSTIAMVIAGVPIIAKSESADATLAFDVAHHRELGADPMVPENRRPRVALISVKGDFSIAGYGGTFKLASSSQAVLDFADADPGEIKSVNLDTLPGWIDPEVDTGSLESEASADLLELVRGDDSGSLLLSLRVALGFRRNEVAALAGKTMLAMGDASAYFGVDGLFSDPKQRLYWSSHLDAVRELMDRSVKDAMSVRMAIAGQNAAMDNADGDTLFRLLIGYSQEQLATGGDAELVTDLESGSLPVRVLASEHLRDISGTTLFFKPDEEVASRREEVVKKWKVRLRKESIRYPEAE